MDTSTLPIMTVYGKVPYPATIQNNENGRSYPATSNIIFGKVEKSGFTKTRTRALVYRYFLATQYLRMKGQTSVP